MTADVVLTLGLEAGPAEAGARVVRRALDQVGAAAGSAVGAVQGLKRTLESISADRAVGELKRLTAATQGASAAHVALGKAAAQSANASLEIGRRLSSFVRDQVRDHETLRTILQRTRQELAESKRTTDDVSRAFAGIAQGLGLGRIRPAADLGRTLQGAAPQLITRLVSLILPGAGGSRGRGGNVNPLSLLGLGGGGRRGGLPGFGGFGTDVSKWLADAFPSLFGWTPTAAGLSAGLTSSAAAESLFVEGATSVAGPLAGIAPFLPMAAIALPMILQGLFSKKPSVGPNANATVGKLATGALGIVDSGADNGGNVQAAIDLAETSIKAMTKTLRQIGGTLGDVNSVAGLQVGYFKGKFFVDDTRLGGSGTYEQNQFENAEAAVADFVRRALNHADVAGISETMRTALKNTKASTFEDLGRHIDFARDYERDFKPLDAAGAQIETLTKRFDDLRDTAAELGLDVGKVNEAFVRERFRLAEDFDRETASGVLDRAISSFRKLAEDTKTRLDAARTLGADIAALERETYYEKRALLLQLGEEERKVFLGLLDAAEKAAFAVSESLEKMGTASQKLESALAGAISASRQAAGTYRQLGESLRDTATSIRLSDLSLLSSADKFAEIRRQYDDAKAAAATGDQDAARRLGGLARSTLELGRQFYGSGPEYAALYQEVVGTLGDTAAIQDGIAFRLDAHTVLLDAQLQVLKEIDKRLEKSGEATGALDYLDLTVTRQGTLTDYDKAIADGEIDRLTELAVAFPTEAKAAFDAAIQSIAGSIGDGSVDFGESNVIRTAVDQLRVLFYEDLQRQVGPDSTVVRAFDLLKTAIDDSASSSAGLAARLRSLGAVFTELKDIFGGAQSPITDPAALQALVGNLAGLLKDVGTVVPGDASGVFQAIESFVHDLPEAVDDVSRIDLGAVATGLGAIGGAIDALGREPSVATLPGDLRNQKNAFRSLGDYLDAARFAPKIDELVGSLDALSDQYGNGALANLRVGLAGLRQPTTELVTAMASFGAAVQQLIDDLRNGTTIGGPRMPEIDRSALTGSGVAQFDTLAARAGTYIGSGVHAGFSEAQLKAAPSWTWAVSERDRIIDHLTAVGDVEAVLDKYYGGQRQIVANADDQGANKLVQRLQDLERGSGGPAGPTPATLKDWVEGRVAGRFAPGSADWFSFLNGDAETWPSSWKDRYSNWMAQTAGDIGQLPAFARGGVFDRPTLGLFGEAGPEAILPLHRGRDGRLGVAANGNAPSDPGTLGDLLAEVRALRQEVADLRRQQAGEHRESIGQGALVAHRLGGRRMASGVR